VREPARSRQSQITPESFVSAAVKGQGCKGHYNTKRRHTFHRREWQAHILHTVSYFIDGNGYTEGLTGPLVLPGAGGPKGAGGKGECYGNSSLAQLKDACRAKGLPVPVGGTKAALRARLEAAAAAAASAASGVLFPEQQQQGTPRSTA
jgi:hypothetical protein